MKNQRKSSEICRTAASKSCTSGNATIEAEEYHQEEEHFQTMNNSTLHIGNLTSSTASTSTNCVNNTLDNSVGVCRSSSLGTPRSNSSLSSFGDIQDEIIQRNCGMTTLWNVDDSIGSISPQQDDDFLFNTQHSSHSGSTSDSLESALNSSCSFKPSHQTIYTIILKWNNDKKKFCFDNDISYYQQPTRASLFTMIQYHQVKERIQKPCTSVYRQLFSSWFNKSSKYESAIKEIKSILKREEVSLNSDLNSVFVATKKNNSPEESSLPGNYYQSVRLSLHGLKNLTDPQPVIWVQLIDFEDEAIVHY